jgi:hypothetical protein
MREMFTFNGLKYLITERLITNNKTNKKTRHVRIQGVTEMYGKILTTSYWFHVELGKNI